MKWPADSDMIHKSETSLLFPISWWKRQFNDSSNASIFAHNADCEGNNRLLLFLNCYYYTIIDKKLIVVSLTRKHQIIESQSLQQKIHQLMKEINLNKNATHTGTFR